MSIPTREERQEDTRRRLLASAAEVFAENGYGATTVAMVARHAGFSTGAVYSNFSGKDDLFLAVYDRDMAQRSSALVATVDAATDVGDLVERITAWFGDFMHDSPAWILMNMEVTLRSGQAPEVARALARRHIDAEAGIAVLLDEQAPRFGVQLRLPARQIAAGLVALGHGLILHRVLDPDLAARHLFRDALYTYLNLPSLPPPEDPSPEEPA